MPKRISIRISGKAEKFLDDMLKRGFSEIEVFSISLGMLQEVVETRRVAKMTYRGQGAGIEYFYSLPGEIDDQLPPTIVSYPTQGSSPLK
ncbi:hypothetical protein GCM10028808_62490 [Spirosoma migulaei]